MVKNKTSPVIFLVIGVLVAFISMMMWNKNSRDGYRSEGSGASYAWKTGASPQQCQERYAQCVQRNQNSPSIGGLGECQQELEFCQEFAT